jgi:RNA polymerase sigma-70 factor (ECF subfamily)
MGTMSKFSASTPWAEAPIGLLLQRRGRFLSFLERSQRSDPDLEDVLQDAFVKSLEHQGSLRDSEKVVAWFYRVLRNELVTRHRRRTRHRRAVEVLRWHAADDHCPEPPPVSSRCIEGLMGRLAPRHRETLEALYAADGDLNALAAQAGITVGHAAVRACRARKALRQLHDCEASVSST